MRLILALILIAFAFQAEARNKQVVNGTTEQVQTVALTAQEEAEADARDATPIVIPPNSKIAEDRIRADLALKGMVKALAKKFGLTEQQLIDAIKAELP